MYCILYDSYVKHRKFLFWRSTTSALVEGLQNRAWGYVRGNKFNVEFTNSFGKTGASLEGSFLKAFGLFFAVGIALGYKDYPEGRSCIAFGFFKKQHLHLVVPGFDANYLYIRMSYKELPND